MLGFAAFIQQVLARVDVLLKFIASPHLLLIELLQRTFEVSRSELFDASLEVYVFHFALNRRVVRIFTAQGDVVVFIGHYQQRLSRRILGGAHFVSAWRNFDVDHIIFQNAVEVFIGGLFLLEWGPRLRGLVYGSLEHSQIQNSRLRGFS